MTPKDKARRVDALYRSEVRRYELCQMIANREGDLDALKRLVADMWRGMCVSYDRDCRDCEHWDDGTGAMRSRGQCEFFRRLREIGVRLDG